MLKRAVLTVGIWAAGASLSSADTLLLRTGMSLKIEALSCERSACVATVKGGFVEVRATDVVLVDPEEEVDAEPATAIPEVARGAASPQTIEQMVAEAARKYAIPRSLVRAVARAESALDPGAVSSKGAMGVMQLMPDTARELGVRNAFDPAENLDAGARRLRQLLEKYEGRVAEALAAYNAGEGAVAKHKGVPPYGETRGYIRRVVKDFENASERDSRAVPEKKP
jgi:hypothetical protein